MKSLCSAAGVPQTMVYPHNLRKLFARMFYKDNPNLAELASLLGHSDINTTRIYVEPTGDEIREKIEALSRYA